MFKSLPFPAIARWGVFIKIFCLPIRVTRQALRRILLAILTLNFQSCVRALSRWQSLQYVEQCQWKSLNWLTPMMDQSKRRTAGLCPMNEQEERTGVTREDSKNKSKICSVCLYFRLKEDLNRLNTFKKYIILKIFQFQIIFPKVSNNSNSNKNLLSRIKQDSIG